MSLERENTEQHRLGRSPEEIEGWLQRRIAELLGVSSSDVDPRQPLAALGLDSVMVLSLVGELEVLLAANIPDQLISPRATIQELSRQLLE
jgi:acyl carrier protein